MQKKEEGRLPFYREILKKTWNKNLWLTKIVEYCIKVFDCICSLNE
ncbi:MAG: hypothetical protein ACI93L_003724 [Cyclobacteriaceae bacterium]|jgi:hypothetical protein